MSKNADKYQALFEMYGTPPPPPKPKRLLSDEDLAGIPESKGKAALVELLELVGKYPIQVWGMWHRKGIRCWLEAAEDWQEEHEVVWLRAQRAWTNALGVIVRYCMDSLPWL
jgi:hypothetical protein